MKPSRAEGTYTKRSNLVVSSRVNNCFTKRPEKRKVTKKVIKQRIRPSRAEGTQTKRSNLVVSSRVNNCFTKRPEKRKVIKKVIK